VALLTSEQVERFHNEGYLRVEDALEPEVFLDPLVEEYEQRLDELADELFSQGKIQSTYADLPFGRRLTRIYAETGKVWAQWFDFSLPFNNVAPDQPCHFGPAVFNLLTCPNLLDIAESLIGPEIYSNPVQHVRLKPPEKYVPRDPTTGRVMLGATPWHQDAGVVREDADETNMLTVWVPIFDATVQNGCLAVVPKNHEVGLLQHCTSPTLGTHLPEQFFDVERAVPLPIQRGGALFLTKTTPHCSLSNESEDVRCSVDLRYNPTGQPTGRDDFPGFVARSRANPAAELRDPTIWNQLWLDTRARLASTTVDIKPFHRWSNDGPGCA
jgi:ectoine hydroxylase-related dioxygenase (phytanoyl-CoA dioxygenase family)